MPAVDLFVVALQGVRSRRDVVVRSQRHVVASVDRYLLILGARWRALEGN